MAYSTVFRFPIGPNVKRAVTLTVPYQGGNPVCIRALPLPPNKPGAKVTHAKSGPNPGQEKGNDFYLWVINPQATDAVTGKRITRFSPPMRVTVTYLQKDEEQGEGRLSLCLAFQRKDGSWSYTILRTKQSKTPKTLTATVDNLFPQDPVGIGVP